MSNRDGQKERTSCYLQSLIPTHSIIPEDAILTADPCILYYLLLAPVLCITNDPWNLCYLILNSVLLATDSCNPHYLLLTPKLYITTDPCTVCYLLLTPTICVMQYWPLPSALLLTTALCVFLLMTSWTLGYLLQTPELWVTYCWSLQSARLNSDPMPIWCYTLVIPAFCALCIPDPEQNS